MLLKNIYNSKKSKYIAAFLSVKNEIQYVLLLCLLLRFLTYAPFFTLWNLSLEKNTIKARFIIEILSNLDLALRLEVSYKFLSTWSILLYPLTALITPLAALVTLFPDPMFESGKILWASLLAFFLFH